MIKEVTIYDLPISIRLGYMNWEDIFKYRTRNLRLVSLQYTGEAKNLKAFNNADEYIITLLGF